MCANFKNYEKVCTHTGAPLVMASAKHRRRVFMNSSMLKSCRSAFWAVALYSSRTCTFILESLVLCVGGWLRNWVGGCEDWLWTYWKFRPCKILTKRNQYAIDTLQWSSRGSILFFRGYFIWACVIENISTLENGQGKWVKYTIGGCVCSTVCLM